MFKMFERYTESAYKAVNQGHVEAQAMGHGSVDTEHILLGLLTVEEGLGSVILRGLDVDLGETKEMVRSMVPLRDPLSAGAHLPFSAHAKRTFDLSRYEALSAGSSYVVTEHVLLGLIADAWPLGVRPRDEGMEKYSDGKNYPDDDHNLVGDILTSFGLNKAIIRDTVVSILFHNHHVLRYIRERSALTSN